VIADRYSFENEKLRSFVKEARRREGLTQEQLANKLGVPQSWVSKVESGERILSFVETRILCAALGMSLSKWVIAYERTLREG
jgi:transcriptional regulator with XRE-family HTH domain